MNKSRAMWSSLYVFVTCSYVDPSMFYQAQGPYSLVEEENYKNMNAHEKKMRVEISRLDRVFQTTTMSFYGPMGASYDGVVDDSTQFYNNSMVDDTEEEKHQDPDYFNDFIESDSDWDNHDDKYYEDNSHEIKKKENGIVEPKPLVLGKGLGKLLQSVSRPEQTQQTEAAETTVATTTTTTTTTISTKVHKIDNAPKSALGRFSTFFNVLKMGRSRYRPLLSSQASVHNSDSKSDTLM